MYFFVHKQTVQSFFEGVKNVEIFRDRKFTVSTTFLLLSLSDFPKLNNWYERLMEREAWQKTELTTEEFEQFKRVFLIIQARKIRQTPGT